MTGGTDPRPTEDAEVQPEPVPKATLKDGELPLALTAGTDPRPPEDAEVQPAPVPKATLRDGKLPLALLFPGQSSQSVRVKLIAKVKRLPAVQEMLVTANEVFGHAIDHSFEYTPDFAVEHLKYCQPAVFIAEAAALEKLRKTSPQDVENCSAVAGLAVGEYTALYAAGVLTFRDGLTLVKARAEAMYESTCQTLQAMLLVEGLERRELDRFCQQVVKEEGGNAVCQVTNQLFPKGFTCSGTLVAIYKLRYLTLREGAEESRIIGEAAVHTHLMEPVAAKLGAVLRQVQPNMKPPRCPVYMNHGASVVNESDCPEKIVGLLIKQLTGPVLWEESIKKMQKIGIENWREIGPMKHLKDMMAKT